MFSLQQQSGYASGGLMPQTMCWDTICTVAEVWCCSEHYQWLFDGGFILEVQTAVYCYRAVFF